MPPSRRTVLAAVLGITALVVAVVVGRILGTVFFAITVAYVLVPVEERVQGRGIPPWWASAITTTVALLATVALFTPLVAILYVRRHDILAFLNALPTQVTVEFSGFAYTIRAGEVTGFLGQFVTRLAVGLARSLPILATKAVVFVFVVFALLLARDRLRRALLAVVPPGYRDIPIAINERVRETLFSLYVIQAATAAGTFIIAAPTFFALGYSIPITLAAVAGILQFLPVVGPSVLILILAGFEVGFGDPVRGAIIAGVGLVLIGFLPDAVLRPRLARRSAELPASLYFVGFAGGILTIGPLGIIAGPLVVAVLVEVLSLLAAEIAEPRG